MNNLFGNIGTFLVDRFTGRNAVKFVVHDQIFTIPNLVTISGILWTFLYVVLYFFNVTVYLIPILIPLIVLTDMIDGWLADHLNQHSKYGKILDPVRDRLFTLALLGNILLVSGNKTLFPLVLLILVELLLACYYRKEYLLTGKVPEVHWLGKSRSAIQWLLGYFIIIQSYWIGTILVSPVLISVIMSLMSIAVYLHYVTYRR